MVVVGGALADHCEECDGTGLWCMDCMASEAKCGCPPYTPLVDCASCGGTGVDPLGDDNSE